MNIFIKDKVLNKQQTLTWNDIVRSNLNLKITEDKNFFWMDKTAWDYSNFADYSNP